jgi:hypothetical protein
MEEPLARFLAVLDPVAEGWGGRGPRLFRPCPVNVPPVRLSVAGLRGRLNWRSRPAELEK